MDQKREQGRKLSLKEMVGTGGREPLRKLVNDKMKSKTQMEPSVRFLTHDDGFYGAFYEPETSAFPGKAMVICSGNEGSFSHAQAVAEKFCMEGMPALALGYWNTEGTPEDACMIPVEYMQSACRWLIRQKGLQPGVWGMSLGAEYALLCASLLPEIGCVIAASPVHILANSLSFKRAVHLTDRAPFTYKGIAVPYLAINKKEAGKYSSRMLRSLLLKREPDTTFYYKEIFKNPGHPEAEIMVENIQGPILLLSGGRDVIAPSKWICRQIMNRLHKNNFAYAYSHHNYEFLSNYVTPARPASASMFRIERTNRADCDASRENCWKDIMAFVRNRWTDQPAEEGTGPAEDTGTDEE